MEQFDGLKRRQRLSDESDTRECPALPEGFGWPAVWAFVTQGAWEDGSPRVTGTILLFWERGRLKACLSDRDAQAVAFVTLTGAGDPLDELEDALRADNIDWRAQKPWNKRK